MTSPLDSRIFYGALFRSKICHNYLKRKARQAGGRLPLWLTLVWCLWWRRRLRLCDWLLLWCRGGVGLKLLFCNVVRCLLASLSN